MPDSAQLTIIVNGQPTQVKANPEAPVQSVVEIALQQTGNAGQPPGNWELRNAQGQPIPLAEEVEEFIGQTLFLNLKAGVGG
jgi:hypothetical protein